MTSITGIGYMKDPQDVNRPGAPSYPVINGADGEPYDVGLGTLLSLLGHSDGTLEGIAREAQVEEEVLAALLALLARRWYDGMRTAELLFRDAYPASVDSIRKEIFLLEAELSRLSGEPLRVWDARSGFRRTETDIPSGGALLEVSDVHEDSGPWVDWHPSLQSAKAALLLMARKGGGALDETGLNLIDGTDRGLVSARITRR